MKKLIFQSLFACGALLNLANCSKDNGNNNNSTPAAAAQSVCTAGSVYTSQGCLPVGNCASYGPNFGWNGTQCISGTTSTTNACGAGMVYSAQYGCLSQCGASGTAGWMNGQCVEVGTQNGSYQTGCQQGGYQNNNGGTINNGYNSGYSNCNSGYNNGGYNNGGYNNYNGGYNQYDRYYSPSYNNYNRQGPGLWYQLSF